MLTKKCASFAILCLFFFAIPSITFAQGTANGTYKFIMEDELMKFFEFDARSDERTTTGYMQYTDEAQIVFQDVDGTGEIPWEEGPFSMTTEFDSMTIEKNRAVIGGFVRDSSYRSYIGKW